MLEGENTPASVSAETLDKAHRSHARQLVALLDGLRQRLGPAVTAAVEDVVAEGGRRRGAAAARQAGGNSLEHLIQALWEPSRADGWEFTLERRTDGVQFRCTRCPLAELARELDATEWFYHLHCTVDAPIAEGFNPEIGLRLTRTLMQGDDHCDHYYFLQGR